VLNHVRTLLLNMAPGSAVYPGEEAVPSAFRPLALPTYLQAIRAKLFGTDPDKAMMNYRLRQYMTILHATQLEKYVTALDQRITYLPFASDLYAQGLFMPQATLLIDGGATGAVIGEPASPDVSGRMAYDVRVEGASASIVVTQFAPRYTVTEFTGTDTAVLGDSGYSFMLSSSVAASGGGAISGITFGLSGGIITFDAYPGAASYETSISGGAWTSVHSGDELAVSPGDTIAIRALNSGAVAIAMGYVLTLPVVTAGGTGSVWQIAGYLPPRRDMSQVLADLKAVGEPTLLSLFGAFPVEPYATFHRMFTRQDQLVYQLGGLLLALAYRTDELWRRIG
jgi:hypothetical protein